MQLSKPHLRKRIRRRKLLRKQLKNLQSNLLLKINPRRK